MDDGWRAMGIGAVFRVWIYCQHDKLNEGMVVENYTVFASQTDKL